MGQNYLPTGNYSEAELRYSEESTLSQRRPWGQPKALHIVMNKSSRSDPALLQTQNTTFQDILKESEKFKHTSFGKFTVEVNIMPGHLLLTAMKPIFLSGKCFYYGNASLSTAVNTLHWRQAAQLRRRRAFNSGRRVPCSTPHYHLYHHHEIS